MALLRDSLRMLSPILLGIVVAAFFLGATAESTPLSLHTVYVAENISGNSTWTLSNSPYVITDDVLVESGAKLIIEPGVEIRFEGNYSILVKGTLEAVGTTSDHIVFSSNKPQPNAGDWNSLIFAAANNESFTIRNSIIEYARIGVTVQSAGKADIWNSEIRSNSFSGIHVEGHSNLLVKENTVEHNENGISSNGKEVSGLRILGNIIRFNGKGIHLQSSVPQGAIISNITISSNTIGFNTNGIYFYIWAGSQQYLDVSLIRDLEISENTVSSNDQYGIYLYSGGPWYGIIYQTVIFQNMISSNTVGIYLYAILHYEFSQHDVLICRNAITGNTDKGLHVCGGAFRPTEQGIKTNLTRNSISYNRYGAFYEGDTDNTAHLNDVYNNTYGMHVANGATVNASWSFWGTVNGPFHTSLNSEGTGNPVNGDGVNLVFKPFLSAPAANNHPTARLKADKTLLAINETATFNASESGDDGRIRGYLVDFGDGSSSGWVLSPIVSHAYALAGSYPVSLTVADDLSYESQNAEKLNVRVQPTLKITLSISAGVIYSAENLTMHVHVEDEQAPVSEVDVTLDSSNKGVLFPQKGRTSSEGDLVVEFTAPSVANETVVVISVNATKEGYWSGQRRREIMVSPKPVPSWLNLPTLSLAVILSLALIILVFMRKRKSQVRGSGLRQGTVKL